MARAAEDFAWQKFHEQLDKHRARLDGMVPIAMLFLPVEDTYEGGEIDVDPSRRVAIMWPPGFTLEQKAVLLERAAAGLRDGSIR